MRQGRSASGSLMFTIQVSGPQSVVISQVYGGGGNSGATLKNDFIELFNRGAQPVERNRLDRPVPRRPPQTAPGRRRR